MKRDEFARAVVNHRLTMGLGQEAFGDLFNTSQQVVAGWEQGAIPNPKILKDVCDLLGLDAAEVSKLRADRKKSTMTIKAGFVLGSGADKEKAAAQVGGAIGIAGRAEISSTATGASIPVISWVQAGKWAEIFDEFHPGEADDFILVCRNVSKNTFALRITGNSMAPDFLPGDIIIVDPAVQPETGKFVVAKIENGNGENGEATFKKFQRDGNKVYLVPLNDKFDVMDMTGVDFTIVGCVVQKTKEY